MADKKVSALTAITNLSQDDLFMVVNDPAGTPTSRKITTGNLFGNVAVITKHSSNTTFTANTTFSGTTMAITANVTLDGTNIESKFVANSYLTSTFTTNTSFQSVVANTNASINDRMQVANTVSLVNSYTANTEPRINKLENFNVGFTVTANGTSGYCFAGGGAANTNNETLYLYKGFSYKFENTAGGAHPFEIRVSDGGAAFSNGVTGSSIGNTYFTVPHAQQSNLVYQCTTHSSMVGTLVIVS